MLGVGIGEARLLRRGEDEDWGPVASRLAEALARFVAGPENLS